MNVIADTEFKMQRVFNLCDAGINMLKKLNNLINELDINSEKRFAMHEELKAIDSIMEKTKENFAVKIIDKENKKINIQWEKDISKLLITLKPFSLQYFSSFSVLISEIKNISFP